MIDFRKDFARVFVPSVCTDCFQTDEGSIFQFRFSGGVLSVARERLPDGYNPKRYEECILEALFVPDLRSVKLDSVFAVRSVQTDAKFTLSQKEYDSGTFGSVAGVCVFCGDDYLRVENSAGIFPISGKATKPLLHRPVVCSIFLKQDNVWNNKRSYLEKSLILATKKIEIAVAEK